MQKRSTPEPGYAQARLKWAFSSLCRTAAACSGLAAGSIAVPVAMVIPSQVSAQTLQDAMTSAFIGNPGLDAERARQRADEETIRQEWAKALPQVSLDASQGREESRHRRQPAEQGMCRDVPLGVDERQGSRQRPV